jgi:hypothetical protein
LENGSHEEVKTFQKNKWPFQAISQNKYTFKKFQIFLWAHNKICSIICTFDYACIFLPSLAGYLIIILSQITGLVVMWLAGT